MFKKHWRKAQGFNVPFILLSIFIVSIIVFGLMGAVTGVLKIGLDNPNAQPLDRFALLTVPFFMVLFVVIFAIVGLRGAGMGGGG